MFSAVGGRAVRKTDYFVFVAEFKRHSDVVAEKKLSFAERFVHKVKD